MRSERVAAATIALSAVLTLGGFGAGAASLTPERVQWIHDASIAANEPLPADVAAIAAATGMSREGELIYRASTPVVEPETEFTEHCSVEGGAVLGCYAAGEIYVYDVTDERLAGTVEVTAAHEMLHAAYERLDEAERARVDALIADYVATIPDDAPVRDDMALYPDEQLADEWHSRLGTEFADLPAELEAYYARWFDDRSLVLALFETANALFTQIEAASRSSSPRSIGETRFSTPRSRRSTPTTTRTTPTSTTSTAEPSREHSRAKRSSTVSGRRSCRAATPSTRGRPSSRRTSTRSTPGRGAHGAGCRLRRAL